MIKHLFTLLFIISFSSWRCQTFVISGKVSDKNEALPFATVLVKGTTYGTNTNINGNYSLKLNAGVYEIVFQYIGYTKKTIRVELSSDKALNVILESEGVSLKEVVVKAGEDPSYPIIRKAIKKRKYYLNQVNTYTCQSYIKGLQRIQSLPKNIGKLIKFTGGEASDTNGIKGIIYLSESESRYYYNHPDEKEIMFSSKVSGDNKAFSFNQLSDVKINFYNNLIYLGNISSRPFTSPIHENAFLFYRFFLLGTINSDGSIIHKIKVVPKRKTDPCFRGVIYIQDSTWRITGVDLHLTAANKINFVDTLWVKQLQAPVDADSVWMPVTLNLSFVFKVFGFRGNGYFNANIKNYNLQATIPKGFFKNELFVVEEKANEKDSMYWLTNRAVPLTQEEGRDYVKKDSVTKVESSDRYRDSLDKRSNKLRLNSIFMGYNYRISKKGIYVSLPGLITNGVQYNTVEGLNLSYKFSVRKEFEDDRYFDISGKSRYGFANFLWGGQLEFNHYYHPKKFSSYGIKLKSIAEQFNRANPIEPLINSAYTLLLNHNYLKLFRETGLNAYYSSEILNGVYFKGSVSYMQRNALFNRTDLLLIDNKNRLFTSNNPQNENSDVTSFETNNALTIDVEFRIRFHQKYYTLPKQKIIVGSKYPQLKVAFRQALPTLGAKANYQLVSANISDNINAGLFGKFKYRLNAGKFLNAKQLYFMDYQHVLGNQTIIHTGNDLTGFRLLPYYQYSANNWFAEAHAEHHFNGFIINKIPFIKKFNIEEVAGAHILSNNQLNYFYEFNFGLKKLFKIFRVDYVMGYLPEKKFIQGFTVGAEMNF